MRFFPEEFGLTSLRSKQLIFTLYGDYIRHVGGSIWVGSLVKLLARFHLSDQSVRSTILRMSRGGWLQVERVAGKSFYSLTPRGWQLLDDGATRIFHFNSRCDPWDGKWRLVTYSIPESKREKREQLRREFGYLGLGQLSSALWISPHDLRSQVERLADSLGLKAHLEFYTATHEGFGDRDMLVERCWNLPHINAEYAAFIAKYQPDFENCRAYAEKLEPCDCFTKRFMLTHEYRRFPFIDPRLPAELLPCDWHEQQAAKLFQEFHDLLANRANAFFKSLFVGPPCPTLAIRCAEEIKTDAISITPATNCKDSIEQSGAKQA